jgi:hypothetical protein
MSGTSSYSRYSQNFQNANAAVPQWNTSAAAPPNAAPRTPYQALPNRDKEAPAATVEASGNLPFGAEFDDTANFSNIYAEAGKQSFGPEVAQILSEPISEDLIEVKPGQGRVP